MVLAILVLEFRLGMALGCILSFTKQGTKILGTPPLVILIYSN